MQITNLNHKNHILLVLIITSVISCTLGKNYVVAQTPTIDVKRAQFLPVTATAEINNSKFQLEVARSKQQQAQGLMFRPPLETDRGMAFPFPKSQTLAFWMFNTPSPLDIVFFEKGVVKAIEMEVQPCKTSPCPIYPPNGVVGDLVIEFRSGTAKKVNLKVGDRVKLQGL